MKYFDKDLLITPTKYGYQIMIVENDYAFGFIHATSPKERDKWLDFIQTNSQKGS